MSYRNQKMESPGKKYSAGVSNKRTRKRSLFEEELVEAGNASKALKQSPIARHTSKTKKQKPKRPRSRGWDYFTIVSKDGKTFVQCSVCGMLVHHSGKNTSNMFKHLKHRHADAFCEAIENRQVDMKNYAMECEKFGFPCTLKVDNFNYNLQLKNMPKKHRSAPKQRKVSVQKSRKLGFVVKPVVENDQSKEVATENEELNYSFDDFGVENVMEDQKPLLNHDETFSQVSSIRRKESPKYVIAQKNSIRINEALLDMLSIDLLPKHILDGEGFKRFVAALCPQVKIPEKSEIEKMMTALGFNVLDDIKQEVNKTKNLAISVDTWIYGESNDMITLLVHFIDMSWKMNSYVLDTSNLTRNNSSDLVATTLKKATDDFEITEKVVAISSNSLNEHVITAAAANVWNHLDCFGTIINDVVNKAMNNVPEIIKIQEKTINAVEFFKNDKEGASSLLSVQKQHNLPSTTFKTYESYDWLATYEMFKLILEQYEAINTVLCYLKKDTMCLCDDEIEIIKNIMEVFELFKITANELSVETFVPASKVIPLANLLEQEFTDRLETAKGTEMDLVSSLVRQIEFKFKNFEANYNFSAATLLDPRFKTHGFKDDESCKAAKERLVAETLTVMQTESFDNQETIIQEPSSSVSLWKKFDKRLSERGAMNTSDSEVQNEITRYFKEPNIGRSKSPLQWWNLNEVQFPNLKVLAKKYLAIPATCVQSDRLFCEQRYMFKKQRDMISLDDIQPMLFLNSHSK